MINRFLKMKRKVTWLKHPIQSLKENTGVETVASVKVSDLVRTFTLLHFQSNLQMSYCTMLLVYLQRRIVMMKLRIQKADLLLRVWYGLTSLTAGTTTATQEKIIRWTKLELSCKIREKISLIKHLANTRKDAVSPEITWWSARRSASALNLFYLSL